MPNANFQKTLSHQSTPPGDVLEAIELAMLPLHANESINSEFLYASLWMPFD